MLGSDEVSLFTDEGVGFSCLPKFGGRLNRLVMDGGYGPVEVLNGFATPEEIARDPYFTNIVMFPFCNRLKDGTYRHGNKTYQFPINEPATNNALHGFLFDEAFRQVGQSTEDDPTDIYLEYRYGGERPAYPFPFQIGLRYSLGHASKFVCQIKATNCGHREAPVSIGWHPYFHLDQAVDELTVSGTLGQEILVDERKLPTGLRLASGWTKRGGVSLRTREIDSMFELKNEGNNEVVLESDRLRLHLTFSDTFRYVHLFIPPGRASIAIEPVSGPINALQTQREISLLQPGDSIMGSATVTLETK